MEVLHEKRERGRGRVTAIDAAAHKPIQIRFENPTTHRHIVGPNTNIRYRCQNRKAFPRITPIHKNSEMHASLTRASDHPAHSSFLIQKKRPNSKIAFFFWGGAGQVLEEWCGKGILNDVCPQEHQIRPVRFATFPSHNRLFVA